MATTKVHGYTATMMQDALCNELKRLFAGKSFTGQKGRKALKVFKQNLPIDNGVDDDTDTNAAASPYIVVLMEGGQPAGSERDADHLLLRRRQRPGGIPGR